MEKLKVAQIARELQCSAVAVYKKLKTIDNQFIVKENGVIFVTKEGVDLLRNSATNQQNKGVNQVNNQVNDMVELMRVELQQKQKIIETQQTTINTLISEHAESQRRSDTIVMKLTNDVGNLQKLIEAKPKINTEELAKPPKPVAAWTPPERKNPLEGASWLTRMYVYLLHPEQLRCECDS